MASGPFLSTESFFGLLCLSQDMMGLSLKVGLSAGVSILFSYLPSFGMYIRCDHILLSFHSMSRREEDVKPLYCSGNNNNNNNGVTLKTRLGFSHKIQGLISVSYPPLASGNVQHVEGYACLT